MPRRAQRSCGTSRKGLRGNSHKVEEFHGRRPRSRASSSEGEKRKLRSELRTKSRGSVLVTRISIWCVPKWPERLVQEKCPKSQRRDIPFPVTGNPIG